MAYTNEVPSDAEVRAVLDAHGPLTAGHLVEALEKDGHSRRDTQRAIRRCLDRGSITLGRDLQIELVCQFEAA